MNINELAQHYASQAYEVVAKNSYAAAGTGIGIATLIGLSVYLSQSKENPDEAVIRRLAREIVELKPTIGDSNAYDFVATHKQYVNEHATKNSSLSMLAAGLRARAAGGSYGNSPEEIVKLGKDLLKDRSGQCDHMAAAVIAKVVTHIQRGGKWNSEIELVGNGGHAFTIMNRNGNLNNPKSWGRQAVIVDTWLGALGVNPKSAHELTAGDHGVVSDPRDVVMNANFFGAGRLKITHRFSVEELHDLARKSPVALI